MEALQPGWAAMQQILDQAGMKTSDVSCTCAGETPPELVLRWGTETFQHLLNIHFSPEAGSAGTALTSSYQLWDASLLHAVPAHYMLQLTWHVLPARVLHLLDNFWPEVYP